MMKRPRWHKVLADLWGNRMRSLLVVASITVGLFAMGVIVTLHQVISEDMRNGYAATNPANIQFSLSEFDQDVVDHVRRMEGVRQAEGVRLVGLRLKTAPGEYTSLDLKGIPDIETMEINRLRLVQGIWPPADREIVLEQYKLPDSHARLGDTITVELPSGKTRQLKLVGVVQDQSIGASGEGGGFFLAPVQGYVTQDTMEWLEQPTTFNQLLVTVNGDGGNEASIQAVADRIRNDIEQNGGSVISTVVRSSFDHPNRTYVDAIVGVLVVLGLLIVFLSGFLITNTLQSLMNQQVQQVGIMKSVGARRMQIAGIYMALIFIFGILAILISIPLSYQVSYLILDFLAREINFVLQGKRIIPQAVALQIGIALVIPQLAAFLPIWQGTRLSVQEALSGYQQDHPHKRSWLDQRITRLRKFSRPLLISLRNTFRHKGRLLLTLTTLTLGGAIFIATFNVQVSMGQYIEKISNYFMADVNLTLDRPYRISEIQQSLSQVPGVKQVEGWASARSELILPDGSVGDSVQLLAPPAGSTLVKPILLSGRWIEPGDENAIALNDRFMSSFPNLKTGDTIRLRVNGKEIDWVVVGFFQLAGKSGGYNAYTNYEYLSRLIHQPLKAISFRIVSSQAGLTQAQQENLGARVEEHLRAQGVRVRDITTGRHLSNTASDGFSILTAFLLFLAVLTALVGSIGLAGTMSMNVMERTREIGVMRAIGASDRILMNQVIVEGMLIGLISWVLGSLAAFPISKILSDSISRSLFDAPSNFGFTITGFGIWLIVVILLSVLASVMPARNAARLTIREVLAYE